MFGGRCGFLCVRGMLFVAQEVWVFLFRGYVLVCRSVLRSVCFTLGSWVMGLISYLSGCDVLCFKLWWVWVVVVLLFLHVDFTLHEIMGFSGIIFAL